MLRVLLAKDLRRAARNPLPWLINLLVPLCMTALIGLAFGTKSDSGALGRIRFAVVDEDQSLLTSFLRGAANQGEGGKFLEPVFLERDAALRLINENKTSAVLIIPTNFTRHYLTGAGKVSLELIKNPAQSIHPAVLEEMLGVVVTALNAISRNLQSEFPEWQTAIEGGGNYRTVARLIERAGDKLTTAKRYINPPLVIYEREVRPQPITATEAKPGVSKSGTSKSAPAFNLFAYLLVGLAAMFLLFLASNALTDLPREMRLHTFERYHTLHHRLLPFVAGKVLFAMGLLLLSSLVMLGGGGLMFRIHWQHPLALTTLTLGYTCFAAGLMATLVALMPDERRAGLLTTITGMGLGLAGGCAFPSQSLPAFLREHISPLLPTYWFAETARNLEFGGQVPWLLAAVKLAGLGALLIGLAALLFRRRIHRGLRV